MPINPYVFRMAIPLKKSVDISCAPSNLENSAEEQEWCMNKMFGALPFKWNSPKMYWNFNPVQYMHSIFRRLHKPYSSAGFSASCRNTMWCCMKICSHPFKCTMQSPMLCLSKKHTLNLNLLPRWEDSDKPSHPAGCELYITRSNPGHRGGIVLPGSGVDGRNIQRCPDWAAGDRG